MKILRSFLSLSLCLFVFQSCAPMPAPAPPPPAPEPEPSRMTGGAVTSNVVAGKTTQAELVELFGAPNIQTVDEAGLETWVYDVKTTSTTTQGSSVTNSRVNAFNVFFGLGLAGSASGQGTTSNNSVTTYTTKSFTLIVKFNPNDTVKEYRMRTTS